MSVRKDMCMWGRAWGCEQPLGVGVWVTDEEELSDGVRFPLFGRRARGTPAREDQ